MPWQKIVISKNEESIAIASGNALGEKLSKAYRDEGAPDDFEVWHLKMSNADHIFYISPRASEVTAAVLTGYRPKACQDKPLLDGFKRVQF
jgi:hypothetical protein